MHEEAWVRAWLRSVMRNSMHWVDPTASTVGVPDAELDIGEKVLVELKYWHRSANLQKLLHGLRPAQYAYHQRAIDRGEKVCILYGTPCVEERRYEKHGKLVIDKGPGIYYQQGFELYLISSKNYLATKFDQMQKTHCELPKAVYITTKLQHKRAEGKAKLLQVLSSKEFWH